jgi:hypothetical protein
VDVIGGVVVLIVVSRAIEHDVANLKKAILCPKMKKNRSAVALTKEEAR